MPLLAGVFFAVSAPAQVLPPDAVLSGKTLGEWNAEFWKWILPIPTNLNPVFDPDGRWASVGQPDGPVFFVVKGYNFSPVPARSFNVPEGKHVFLPLIGLYQSSLDEVVSIEELHDRAARGAALIDELHAEIDGVPVPDLFGYRAKSPAFSIDFPVADNLFDSGLGRPFTGLLDPVVADGYALLVAPLPPGVHVIRFGGRVGPPVNRGSSATHTITVVGMPPAQLVHELSAVVAGLALPPGQRRALLGALEAAEASFASDDSRGGLHQLHRFQSDVRAQVVPRDALLGEQLLQAAQDIIDRAATALSQPSVLPNDALVDGRSLGEWSAEWWKWILPIPTNQNPGLDPDGSRAGQGQPGGSVFFVANIGDRSRTVSRSFEVPEGSHLFFPVRFVSVDNVDFPTPLSVEELRDGAASVVALMTNLYAVIDGRSFNVSAHRVRSPAFSVEFESPDNLDSFVYGHPVAGLVDPIVSDGYWLMVEPLSVGEHVLRFGGQVGSPFNSSKDVEAFITVVPLSLTRLVAELIAAVDGADVPRQNLRPLRATLGHVQTAFQSERWVVGINLLRAFQNKVRAQIEPQDPALGARLMQAAQNLMDRAQAQMERLPPG